MLVDNSEERLLVRATSRNFASQVGGLGIVNESNGMVPIDTEQFAVHVNETWKQVASVKFSFIGIELTDVQAIEWYVCLPYKIFPDLILNAWQSLGVRTKQSSCGISG